MAELTLLLPHSPLGLLIYLAVLAIITYCAVLALHRLYLSPLAKFPGPKLAALTSGYEFYYDCFLNGHFIFKVDELHAKYGPIVRIGPSEVHINDPDYHHVLYSPNLRLDKDQWFYNFLGTGASAFTTGDADLHRSRRSTLSKYFSMARVNQLEPLIRDRAAKLLTRLKEYGANGRPIPMSNAYRCLTLDIIAAYSYPRPINLLDTPDFGKDFHHTVRNFASITIWNRYIQFLMPALASIPPWLSAKIDPSAKAVASFLKDLEDQGREIMSPTHPTTKSPSSILHGIYNSDQPESERTLPRLTAEAHSLFGAGTETTGNTLSVITYHLLADSSKSQRLKSELLNTFGPLPASQISSSLTGSSLIPYTSLQTLPYLNALILEGLRLGNSVSSRLPRINRTSDMTYAQYNIPAGTTISMNQRDVHLSSDVFPNPHSFSPERWLDPNKKRELERYFVPFSTGSRACVGQNLAMVELYLALGNLWRILDLRLYETTARDISVGHDYFSPFVPQGSKGLQATLVA